MAVRAFRGTVGHKRIVKGTLHNWQEGYTRAIRSQLEGINKHITALLAEAQHGLIEDIGLAFRPVFDLSQKYVPVYTGRLRESGFYKVSRGPKRKRTIIYNRRLPAIQIGYAAAGKPPYSVIVHEDLKAKHTPPTRAKFLEAALHEGTDDAIRRTKLYIGERLNIVR